MKKFTQAIALFVFISILQYISIMASAPTVFDLPMNQNFFPDIPGTNVSPMNNSELGPPPPGYVYPSPLRKEKPVQLPKVKRALQAPEPQFMIRDRKDDPDYPDVIEWTCNACQVCVGTIDDPIACCCYIPCCPLRISCCLCLCALTPCRSACKCCMLTDTNKVLSVRRG